MRWPLQLLAPTMVTVGVASNIHAQGVSLPGNGFASGQELKLVFKVQADAGTNARNRPGEGQSAASEEPGIVSDTTGTLEGCVASWDRGTHMTKNEWRTACKRVNNERSRETKHD
jgi:hypothetical protein